MKKNVILFIALFTIVGSTFSQSTTQYHAMLKGMYKNTVAFINAAELKLKLSEPNAIVILDTRKQSEYDASHIDGAKFVDYDTFTLEKVKDIAKSDTIVVYCSVGYRSERVGEKLRKAGYKNVFNLYGGLFEWVNLGFDVVDNTEQKTDKIHAYNKDWGKWLTNGDKVYE
ncbi:MAG: rhodanese-like domain-containing protein [Paludibacter sp.]|nr:rhodanese-like domain-containing protein [Paludibacter sp.]